MIRHRAVMLVTRSAEPLRVIAKEMCTPIDMPHVEPNEYNVSTSQQKCQVDRLESRITAIVEKCRIERKFRVVIPASDQGYLITLREQSFIIPM